MAARSRLQAPELRGVPVPGAGPPPTLAGLRGRVAVLHLFSPGDATCTDVVDELRELGRRFGDAVALVSVLSPRFPAEADPRAAAHAVDRLGLDHPVLHDRERRTWKAFGARAWPTLALLDPEGQLVLRVEGAGRGGQLAQSIEVLLAAQRTSNHAPPPGPPASARGHSETALRFPAAVAWDARSGTLAVADTGHHRIVLLDRGGRLLAIVGGGPGLVDGPFEVACFRRPAGLCFLDGDLYVADTGNGSLRRVPASSRSVETLDTPPLAGPAGLAAWRGEVIVALACGHRLGRYAPGRGWLGVLAGSGREGLLDGVGTLAELAQPAGLAVQADLLAVADAAGSALRLVAWPARGEPVVSTAVGTGDFEPGDVDGVGPRARLQRPLGLAAVEGAVLVADSYNHRLRRFDVASARLSTLAGSSAGYADGDVSVARFDGPADVAVVGDEAIVADLNNHALRRVELATGRVSTLVPAGLGAPGVAPRLLPAARLAAEAEVELVLPFPALLGRPLDREAGPPVRVRVSGEPAGLLHHAAEHAAAGLPVRVAVRTGAGRGVLRLDSRVALADADGPHVHESALVLPVVLAPDADARLLVDPGAGPA